MGGGRRDGCKNVSTVEGPICKWRQQRVADRQKGAGNTSCAPQHGPSKPSRHGRSQHQLLTKAPEWRAPGR